MKIAPIKIDPIKLTHKKPEKKTPEEITKECLDELSAQAKQIKSQEDKLKERMDFDNDRTYYFSIVFKSTEDRNRFLKQYKIKLKSDDYVFYDDIKDIFK